MGEEDAGELATFVRIDLVLSDLNATREEWNKACEEFGSSGGQMGDEKMPEFVFAAIVAQRREKWRGGSWFKRTK